MPLPPPGKTQNLRAWLVVGTALLLLGVGGPLLPAGIAYAWAQPRVQALQSALTADPSRLLDPAVRQDLQTRLRSAEQDLARLEGALRWTWPLSLLGGGSARDLVRSGRLSLRSAERTLECLDPPLTALEQGDLSRLSRALEEAPPCLGEARRLLEEARSLLPTSPPAPLRESAGSLRTAQDRLLQVLTLADRLPRWAEDLNALQALLEGAPGPDLQEAEARLERLEREVQDLQDLLPPGIGPSLSSLLSGVRQLISLLRAVEAPLGLPSPGGAPPTPPPGDTDEGASLPSPPAVGDEGGPPPSLPRPEGVALPTLPLPQNLEGFLDFVLEERDQALRQRLLEARKALMEGRQALERADSPMAGGASRLQALLEGSLEAVEALLSALEPFPVLRDLWGLGLFSPAFSQQAPEALAFARSALDRARGHLEEARARLCEGPGATAPLCQPVRQAEALLGEAQDAVALASFLLGLDRPRTVLVLGQKEAEVRPTGGFLGFVWEVQVGEAQILQKRSLYSYEVESVYADTPVDPQQFPLPPEALRRYLWGGVWLFRDSNWDPDFPTSARRALQMYARWQGVQAEGAVALTMAQVARFLEVVGPLEVPEAGVVVDASSLPTLLLEGVPPPPGANPRGYSNRVWFAGVLGKALMDRLTGPLDEEAARGLLKAMLAGLESRDLQIYLADPLLQTFLERQGWAGRVGPLQGDGLMVVDTNVYGAEVPGLVDPVGRRWTYRVRLLPDGSAEADLALEYHNREPAVPPEECLQGRSCFWDYLRLYLPAGARLEALPSLPLHPGSLAVRLGREAPGQDTLRTYLDAPTGRRVVEGLLVVAGGERKTLRFRYRVPGALQETVAGLYRYALRWERQAGTLPHLRVEIAPPPGWRIVALPPPLRREGEQAVWEGVLDRDLSLTLVVAPSEVE